VTVYNYLKYNMYTTTEEDSVAPKRKWICEGERMRARYITIATQKLSKKKTEGYKSQQNIAGKVRSN